MLSVRCGVTECDSSWCTRRRRGVMRPSSSPTQTLPAPPCSMWPGPCQSAGKLMKAPIVRCDQAQWTLFGISLAGFNAILSLGGAFTILWLMRKSR